MQLRNSYDYKGFDRINDLQNRFTGMKKPRNKIRVDIFLKNHIL